MKQGFDVFQCPPLWPAVLYFAISIVIFILLCFGKARVNKAHKYPLFIFYTLFVIAIAAIQINIFANGYDFVKGFLHIDFDPYRYDSVYWGSLCFSLLYLFAMPKNKF
ncbi:hypothetical protein FEM41_08810 [Jejubacter calystegiae]|uniref:Uncharacterized protein n=1 Tax=Jejubacter calystegiae TaxID=2579935 RepID=A0A4P8YIN4_9ENTR|nr:hypothetical protein [Jejubacter calystegiae]QCT19746.1 hypothetical protein FEM41_08810 [Jejubacter calystegiae]